MCSISGWVAEKPLNIREAYLLAKALLYYGSTRGKQSAGIWFPGMEAPLKRAVEPETLVVSEEWQELWRPLTEGPSICLMHTRQPTCGGRGDAQAQPFVADNVVTVHNGWYQNTRHLKDAHSIEKPSGVDSELVATYIAQHGIEAIKEFFHSAVGSSAVGAAILDNDVWEVYLTRDGNPIETLSLTLEDNAITIFASTETMLLNAARHAYLIPPSLRTVTLPTNSLHILQPSGPDSILEWESKWSSQSRGSDSHHYGYRRGWMDDDGYDPSVDEWTLDKETGRWSRLPKNGVTTTTNDSSTTDQSSPTIEAPSDLPDGPAAQSADLEDLMKRAPDGKLTINEQTRLGWYLLQEDA